MQLEQLTMKRAGDATSIGALLGYIAGWLPPIATLLTIVWMAVCLYESDTFKKLVRRFRGTK